MYSSFLKLAQEDAAHGEMQGLRCLFKYFKKTLSACFEPGGPSPAWIPVRDTNRPDCLHVHADFSVSYLHPHVCAEHYLEFEQLAHRYLDYLDYDYGIRCLLELLTMGGAAAAASAGHPLAPATVALLEAWQQHMDMCAALGTAAEDPRLRLHKHLADKRKGRSKAQRSREAREVAGVAAVEGDAAEGTGTPPSATSPSQPPHSGKDKTASLRGASPSSAQRPPRSAQRKEKAALRAKAQPFLPQAQPQKSLSPQARALPDRLGDFLGN